MLVFLRIKGIYALARYQFIVLLILLSWLSLAKVLATPLNQDDYLYRVWSVEAGLPQISVTTMVQDAQGFLWVGTQNGLARFDGINFRVFNTANTPSFSSNLITALHIDSQQRLWIGTVNGLMRYQDNVFIQLDNLPLHGGVTSIAERTDGTVFIGAANLYQWQEQENKLVAVQAHQRAVFGLYQQRDTLYIGSENGFGVLSQDGYQWHAMPEGIEHLQITKLAKQGDDVYLGTTRGLFSWRREQWQVVNLSENKDKNRIEMLYLDPQQRLWVSCSDMLYQIDKGQIFTAEQMQGKAEEFSWIASMLQDKFGNLWLGSQSHGLKRLRRPPTQRFSSEQGIIHPYVWSIQPWQQHLLAGTNKGISLLRYGQFQPLMANQYLPNPLVYSMLLDSQQRLWVGTRGGLSRLDGNTLAWQRNYYAISHLLVTTLEEENERVWVGTNAGLYYLQDDELQQRLVPEALRHAQIRIVMLDSQKKLWVGTENGLYLRDGDSFVRLENMPLSGSFISTLKQLDDGNIFIGSYDQGFVIGHPENWQWFTQKQGLPGNGVMHVEQVEHQLLISNLQGFYRINYPALVLGNVEAVYMLVDDRRPESVTDSHRCCNGAGSSKGAVHQGKLWYPTLDGVLALPLQQLVLYGSVPQPVFEVFSAGNSAEEQDYLSSTVALKPDQRDWHFRFTAPFFVQASSVQFRYKLQGYDTDWINAGRRREAFYTNLPPGQYSFIIQVRLAADYRWSDPLTMQVNLSPYWHETSTARALFLLVFLLLFWALYRWRLMKLAKARRELEQVVEERTNELYQANQKLQHMSMQDALTGLNNRHYLDANIEQILSRANRSNEPLIWALLDLDHFKRVNDTLGHQTGDNILIIVADLLRQNSRSVDHLIRWGGEEFLLILEHSEDALLVLQRIHQAINDYPWQQEIGLKQPLTCSVGAVTQHYDWDWQHSLRLADQALYWVKEHGRNGYMLLEISSPPPSEILAENVDISQLLLEGKLQAVTNKNSTTVAS